MNPLVERKGFKIESTISQKKKAKDKKPKGVEHVHIIDDDAPVPWTAPTMTTTIQPDAIINDDIVSVEDAPVVVGKDFFLFEFKVRTYLSLFDIFRYC
jgi:hypothetical protein